MKNVKIVDFNLARNISSGRCSIISARPKVIHWKTLLSVN
jgi:hypothetical protein